MAKGQVLNLIELSAFYGINRTTAYAWLKRGMPYIQKADQKKGQQWQFDSAAVADWREKQAALNAVGDIDKLDLDEAKRRKMAAEAALAELALSKERGDVVSISEIGDIWMDIVSSFRARILAIAPKLAPIVAPVGDIQKVRDLIESEVEESLDELSRYDTGNFERSEGES